MTRRTRRRIVTHVMLALLTALVCWLMLELPAGNPRVTRQLSLALGYLGTVLLALTLLVGPWRALSRGRTPVNIYLRRDIGLWAAATAGLHVLFGLQNHMRGDVVLFFFRRKAGETVPLLNAFGLSNYLGAVACVVLLLLVALSNDLSLRTLRARLWKLLQRFNYVTLPLVVVHAVIYQDLEERARVLRWMLAALAAATVAFQVVGMRAYRGRAAGSSRDLVDSETEERVRGRRVE